MEDRHLYQFGEFELCVEERALRRGGENISLTPKMYELLLVLIRNPNRILDKDFLLSTIWPDSFVEESNITFNIRQLRKALADNVQEPKYIETIPRRGYRFIHPVVNTASAEKNSAIGVSQGVRHEAGPARRAGSQIVMGSAILIFLIAASGLTYWFLRGSRPAAAPILSAPFASEKLSTDGLVTQAIISPDGKTIVYAHRNGSNQSLWIRQVDNANNIEIIPPSVNFYGGLAFSPDGNTIYFSRGSLPRVGQQIDIYRMSIYGGVPQKLIEQTQGWISVSPQGDRLSFVRCFYKDEDYCSLWVADAADGRNEKMLVAEPRPIRIADNKISRDGRKVAFAVGQSRTASNEFSFREVDIETGEQRDLSPERFFNINYIVWLPDQSGWLLTARKLPDKNYRIWHVSAENGEASQLTSDSETYSRISLDATGTLLVATRIDGDFSLNIYKRDDAAGPPRTLSKASSVNYAPNGKIVYSSLMSGDHEIWSSNADGTDQRQLTNDPADDIAPIVSPDNQYIFFDSNRSGKIHVWRMDIDGTDPVQITTDEGGFPLAISPGRDWLYYRSGLHNAIRRVSLRDHIEEPVYDLSGQVYALSRDASKLALLRKEEGGDVFDIISLVDNKVVKTVRAADSTRHPIFAVWSHDGNYLAYVVEDDMRENRSLWFDKLDGSKPVGFGDLRTGEISELSSLDVSYDSKTFAVIQGTWNHNALLIRGLKP